MRGLLNVTGQHVLPKGGVFTVPNAKATCDVFAVHFTDGSTPDTVAIRGERVGNDELGFTRYVVPHDFAPGVRPFSLVPTDVSTDGLHFRPHPAVANDPRELVAHIGNLPGGATIEWDVRPPKIEVFESFGELRWTLRGVSKKEHAPKMNAQLHLDMAPDKPLVDFSIGINFHDEALVEWFVAGGRPTVSFPEAEVVQLEVEMQTSDRSPTGQPGFWRGGLLVIRGTLVCTKAAPPVQTPTGPQGELEPVDDEGEEFPWQNDASVGRVFMRLDGGEWDGYAGATRAVLADILDDEPLPPIYFSADGARNVNATPQTGGREAFGIALDTAAFVSRNLVDVFGGLERGTMQEALRPIHWFDDDGQPLDLENRPGVTCFNSVPDWRFSTDLLGAPAGWWQHGGLTGQDEAHLTHRYTFTLYYLTGDRIAREILNSQANVLWSSLRGYTGQPRLVGRVTLFAAFFREVAPNALWVERMETLATEKAQAYLDKMRAIDAELGVTDFRSAAVYMGDADSHPSGYARGLSAESVAIAGFQVSLSIMGPLVWFMRTGDRVLPAELFERLVKVGETVFRFAFEEREDVTSPTGSRLFYSYALGWNGGEPITDRTPGTHLSTPGVPSYAVRGTLYPLAFAVISYGSDEAAKTVASKLIAADPDSFRNARWRAIEASAPN